MIRQIRSSLLLQITAIFLLTSVLLGVSIITVQRRLVLNHLKEQALEQHAIVGRSISENLKNKIKAAETLAAALANISLVLPKNPETFKRTLPSLIDYASAKHYIAGGGIWPEPGAFTKGIERRSFFWGRNQDGILEYYDDYNNPEGNGYHHEEWYVPARYMKDDQCYWSKSYVDSYSYQPMVTCTIAIRENGHFLGVSTIDLKLEGLSDILSQNMKPIGGYAFALDRNNKFLAFPDESKIHRGGEGTTEAERREYIDTATMIERAPDFRELALALEDALADPYKNNSQSKLGLSQEELIKKLDEDSYQIDDTEAQRIARFLIEKDADTIEDALRTKHILLEHDAFLKQPAYATIFFLPKTDWKLVLVTPTNRVLGTVNKMAWLVGLVSVGLMLLILMGFFAALRNLLISPLQDIIRRLKNSGDTGKSFGLLDEGRGNEIGDIARWYNLRTRQLIDSRNEAERANKAKSEFLANMSHELRTPLNSIMGLSDLLQSEAINEEQKESVSTIYKSSESLLSIVNDILDLSKIEEGRFDLETIPFSIHDLASNVLDALSPIASNKGLILNLYFQNNNYPVLLGDPLRIERILTNLVGNALKYTLEGKVDINIYCEWPSDDRIILHCEVMDTGIGIETDKLPLIFNKFTQADETITRKFGGTGLGLYITKNLATLMGGDITVTSELGRGSCFTFHVPLQIAKSTEGTSTKKKVGEVLLALQKDRSPIESIRVLVAEDMQMNIVIVKKLLQFVNIGNYDIARDGAEALKMFTSHHYDLVLMDCHMPELSGYECTAEIRKVEKERKITTPVPIVAMTADAMLGTREKCLEAGMSDYISKPIDKQRFKEILSQWFIVDLS